MRKKKNKRQTEVQTTNTSHNGSRGRVLTDNRNMRTDETNLLRRETTSCYYSGSGESVDACLTPSSGTLIG